MTYLDLLPRLKTWIYCSGYKDCDGLHDTPIDATVFGGVLTSFRFTDFLSLAQRTQFTYALSAVTPEYKACNAEDETVIRRIEMLIGQPVAVISRGPMAEHVEVLNALPR